MASQNPEKSSEKSLKRTEESVGALLFSEGTNADLLLMGSFCTYDIFRCYSLYEQFYFINTWEPGGLYFWKTFLSFSGTALFLRSGLTVYQTATSKTITYWAPAFNLSWKKENTTPLWHHLLGGNLGWRSPNICSSEEFHGFENGVVVFFLWYSLRVTKIRCFWELEVNYTISGEVWGGGKNI